MKLRNKKTGKIIETDYELSISVPDDEKFYGNNTYTQIKGYTSIKELSEEWEDVPEEPKLFYVVDLDGEILPSNFEDKTMEKSNELGNHFSSREEAELAVRKLKAWKRLKDDDFKFIGWYYDVQPISNGRLNIQIRATLDESDNATLSDLDLLFSGGEE